MALCHALHHPEAFNTEAKPFGGQSSITDIKSMLQPAQPFSGPQSLSLLGYSAQLELLPTRQQHQLQLLISSGCDPGWNRVRGSC